MITSKPNTFIIIINKIEDESDSDQDDGSQKSSTSTQDSNISRLPMFKTTIDSK